MPRPGVAIGNHILDLKALAKSDVFIMYCTCQFDYETLSQVCLDSDYILIPSLSTMPVYQTLLSILHNVISCRKAFLIVSQSTLNAFAALGRETVGAIRSFIKYVLVEHTPLLRDNRELRSRCIVEQSKASMHLPFAIGDFTDFLNSRTVGAQSRATGISRVASVLQGAASDLLCSTQRTHTQRPKHQ